MRAGFFLKEALRGAQPQRGAKPRGDAHGAAHGAGARRLHPCGPGHDGHRQPRAQPRGGERLPRTTPPASTVAALRASWSRCRTRSGSSSSPSSRRSRSSRRSAREQGRDLAAGHQPAASHLSRDAERPGQGAGIVGALVQRPRTGKRTFTLGGIENVRNREQDTSKILSATSLVKLLTAGMAALLVLASIALIANTIRLSIFARRREVEVMKLVGATNWFIRWPFVIEGVIVGFMGGLPGDPALVDRQGHACGPAGGPLRADRRAEHDPVPGLIGRPARLRAWRSLRWAAGSRCAASYGSSPKVALLPLTAGAPTALPPSDESLPHPHPGVRRRAGHLLRRPLARRAPRARCRTACATPSSARTPRCATR